MSKQATQTERLSAWITSLTEQRERLVARLDDLSRIRADPSDIPASVKRLAEAANEQVALPKIVDALDMQIGDLRTRLAVAEEAGKQERIAAAKQAMARPLQDVVRAVQQLDAVIGEYNRVLQAVAQAGGMPLGDVPAGLVGGVKGALGWWRAARPELVGLKPPDRRQEQLDEARAAVRRAEGLLQDAQAAPGHLNGADQLRKHQQQALELAKARLAELEGSPVRQLLGV